jgi:hypothetical protein
VYILKGFTALFSETGCYGKVMKSRRHAEMKLLVCQRCGGIVWRGSEEDRRSIRIMTDMDFCSCKHPVLKSDSKVREAE